MKTKNGMICNFHALFKKNTVFNTGRKAISDSGELSSVLVYVSGAFGDLDSNSC